ncbi:hypothetical protein PVAP13_8NG220205 [Panicum virgatum]|uniref:Potassium channel domain-containing protein n=1 Tax=Panicum virgatum TaxID=38727 RepID=A0A8T0P764_PANVG|nr:hypothetical protein PVAP13_8NG220205 [Panicum virgatum]
MAENRAKQPLLKDGDHPNAGETRSTQGAGAKRFRSCRTAPSADAAQDSPPGSKNPSHQERGRSAGSPPFAPPKELLRGARPSFRLVGVLLLAYLIAGTIAFYLAMDHMSGARTRSRVVDALYFCVVTMTTVGYGDLVPASDAAKLLACAFVFSGVALVGTFLSFLSKAADYLVEKQEALLFRALHLRRAGDRRALRECGTWSPTRSAALVSGTAFLVEVEGMRPVDAFYCVCATVTTLGTVVVALFFLYAAELGAEQRQRALAWWVLRRRTTCADLKAVEVDMDGDHRLKELGKISQEEIAEFLEEYDQLDADNSDTLSPHDLIVAQPG